MLFFKSKKEKVTDWFYKAKDKLREKGTLPSDTEIFPANVHFHVHVGKDTSWVSLEEVTDKEELSYENLVQQVDYWRIENVKFDKTLHSDCINNFRNMLNFVEVANNKWKRRVAARKLAEQTAFWRNAGLVVVIDNCYIDYCVRIQPVDLDTYLGKCSEYMADKVTKDYPFDVDKYRKYLIGKFACACNVSENKLNAEFPPINVEPVETWYMSDVREVVETRRIEERNKTCQKTLDEIKAKCDELKKTKDNRCVSF